MTDTRPVTYRQLTADEVLAELRQCCRNWGCRESDLAKLTRPDAALCDLVGFEPEADWGDLISHHGLTLPDERWVETQILACTVADFCEAVADLTKIPVIEPATIFGRPCETAGAFLTLRKMLADDGADVSELGPSSALLPYVRENPEVFRRFRLAVADRLPAVVAVAPWSCLAGGLLVVAGGSLIWTAPWLLVVGGAMILFGLTRPRRYPSLDGIISFRDLIHAALGRKPRTRAA